MNLSELLFFSATVAILAIFFYRLYTLLETMKLTEKPKPNGLGQMILNESMYLIGGGVAKTISFILMLLNPADLVYVSMNAVNTVLYSLLFIVIICSILYMLKNIVGAQIGEGQKSQN